MLVETIGAVTPDDIVIFTHIPKCAGSTLREHVRKEHGKAMLASYRKPERDMLRNLPRGEHREYRFVFGHDPYGLHRKFMRRPIYLSVVREPLDRMISYLYYIKENATAPFHEESKNLTFLEMLSLFREREASILTNQQCTFLGGASFEAARANIQAKYYLVVASEQLPLLVKHLVNKGVLANSEYENVNITKSRPPSAKLSKEETELILSENEEDAKLVDFVRHEAKRLLSS